MGCTDVSRPQRRDKQEVGNSAKKKTDMKVSVMMMVKSIKFSLCCTSFFIVVMRLTDTGLVAKSRVEVSTVDHQIEPASSSVILSFS